MFDFFLQEIPELQVFKTVLYYCICIVAMPLVSFFVSKNFIFDGIYIFIITPIIPSS